MQCLDSIDGFANYSIELDCHQEIRIYRNIWTRRSEAIFGISGNSQITMHHYVEEFNSQKVFVVTGKLQF
jgi:hypothetical protein